MVKRVALRTLPSGAVAKSNLLLLPEFADATTNNDKDEEDADEPTEGEERDQNVVLYDSVLEKIQNLLEERQVIIEVELAQFIVWHINLYQV